MAVLSRFRVAFAAVKGLISQPSRRVLNHRQDPAGQSMSAREIALNIEVELSSLLQHYVDQTGSHVQYGPLRRQAGLAKWIAACNLLPHLDMAQLNASEKAALVINVYNGLTIHALVQHRRKVSSVLEISGFWGSFAYNIGGLVYTLDELEHGILRGNAGHPIAARGASTFDGDDPRSHHVMALDPRIHFALVCGAKGCPQLRAYQSATLDADLSTQAAEYLKEKVTAEPKRNMLVLPKLAQWYSVDFGSDQQEVVALLTSYAEGETRSAMEAVAADAASLQLAYGSYNWDINK